MAENLKPVSAEKSAALASAFATLAGNVGKAVAVPGAKPCESAGGELNGAAIALAVGLPKPRTGEGKAALRARSAQAVATVKGQHE